MPAIVQTFEPGKKFVIKVYGNATAADIAVEYDLICRKLSDRSGKVDTIWDFLDANTTTLAFDTVTQIADMIVSSSLKLTEGCSALVIGQGAEKYLADYFISHIDSQGYHRKIRLFNNIEQAKEYLEFPDREIN